METIFLGLTGCADPPIRISCYRIAGRRLAVDRPVAQLEGFCIAAGSVSAFPSASTRERAADNGKLIHDGTAWVGNATRRVQSWFNGSAYEIRITGIGSFSVSGDGREIFLLEQAGYLEDAVLIEAALGPALVLAMAIGSVFCLHASAIVLGDGVVLFLGESGAGKSTLAEKMQDVGAGITRLTDDISPLRCDQDRFELQPDFPQLKISASEQYTGHPHHPSLTVNSIYTLIRIGDGKEQTPQAARRRLGPADSFSKLIGQSVASRIFEPDLLGRHTRQIAKLTNLVPVYELSYPNGTEKIDTVREFLLGTLR